MDILTLRLDSLTQTAAFGSILGSLAVKGDVILLAGNLGAGKTTLAQAIAAGLDVPSECYVISPSFSLLLEYPGRIPLYHIDCYRLEDEDDVEGSGIMDYIVADGVAVVEWPDRLGRLKPPENLTVEIATIAEGTRRATVTPHGQRWQERMERLARACRAAFIEIED